MSPIKLIPKPYVGTWGSANTLQVRHLDDRFVIRFAPGLYLFIVFILVVAVGGLPYVAYYGFPNPHGGFIYQYFHYFCWAFAALLWYILIRYLLGMPRIEIPQGSGEMQFFKYRGNGPDMVIRWAEIQGFSVNVEPYFSDEANCVQHVLYLQKKAGDPIPLCGSVDEKLIVGLKTELEGLLGGKA